MPFKSQRQAGYLLANKPSVAQEFMQHTPSVKTLPQLLPAAKAALQTMPLRKRKK